MLRCCAFTCEMSKNIVPFQSVMANVMSTDIWGFPWEPQSSLSSTKNVNERVKFACPATLPYTRVYKMAVCIHLFRFLLQRLVAASLQQSLIHSPCELYSEFGERSLTGRSFYSSSTEEHSTETVFCWLLAQLSAVIPPGHFSMKEQFL